MQLADTNIVSELMRQSPEQGVAEWMRGVDAASARLAVSAVTVDEIVFGLSRRPNVAKLAWFDRFVVQLSVLDVTETIARRAGEMRALLASRGQARTQADMLIAATAQVHALTVVTRNVRDFEGCGVAVLNPFKG
jgi:predicted nucleic acid-binding protein